MAYLEELLPDFRKGAKIRYRNWKKDEYICIKNDKVVDEKGNYLNDFYCGYLKSDDWEFYKELIDWNYIIKNKCLCWFWDDNEEKNKRASTLADYDSCNNKFARCIYNNIATIWFDNCRPVRKDEVTFYEDRKDVAED